jgi:hypothetical protein
MLLNAPVTAIHATGNIKRISFYSGTVYLVNPLFVWLAFHFGAPVWSAYVLAIAVTVIVLIFDLYFVKVQIPAFPVKSLVAQMLRLCAVFVIAFVLTKVIDGWLLPSDTFLSLIAVILIGMICISTTAWCFALSAAQKQFILTYVAKHIPMKAK